LIISGKKLQGVLGNPIQDTTYTIFFTIASAEEFGEMEGAVLKRSSTKKSKGIVVAELIGEGIRFETQFELEASLKDTLQKSPFIFPRLPEGRYFLSAYESNGDSLSWNAGKLSPYTLASPFVIGEDSVRVRKRWKTNAPVLEFRSP
jgi:hypothetical protein